MRESYGKLTWFTRYIRLIRSMHIVFLDLVTSVQTCSIRVCGLNVKKNQKIFSDYLARIKLTIRSPADFQKLVMRSGRDPGARRALLARNKARDVAYNSSSKLAKLSEILEKHSGSKIFIFTEHNKLVHKISRQFLIPSITYRTTSKERSENLDRFRSGVYRAVVTSKSWMRA